MYMRHRHYISTKHQFHSMKDHFNGNTKKRHPPPQVMKSIKWLRMFMLSLVKEKGLARILKKMTCGRSNRFFGS
jgi:hypothetical protein